MKHLSASMYIGVFIVAYGAIVYQQYATETVATVKHQPTRLISVQQIISYNITVPPRFLPAHIATGGQSSTAENMQNNTPASIDKITNSQIIAMR